MLVAQGSGPGKEALKAGRLVGATVQGTEDLSPGVVIANNVLAENNTGGILFAG